MSASAPHSSQPSTTTWSTYALPSNFYSGKTVHFYVWGGPDPHQQGSLVAQATAHCPVCGDYPNQVKC